MSRQTQRGGRAQGGDDGVTTELEKGKDRKQTGMRRKMEGVIGAAPERRAGRWMMDGEQWREVNRRGKTNGHEPV